MRNFWVAFTVILVIAGVVYGNTLQGSFLVDDYFFIDRPGFGNPKGFFHLFVESVLPWHKESSLYRPILVLSMAIQMFLFGRNPIPYHIVNILLHVVNTGLVVILTKKVFKNSSLALISGLLFAVLPIHTEAVANIKSRDELFAAAFLLMSWILLCWSPQFRKRYFRRVVGIGIVITVFLGMLSKEFAVLMFPVFLAVCYWKQVCTRRSIVLWSVLWVGVVCIYAWLRYAALGAFFLGDDVHITSNPLKYATGWRLVWTPFSLLWIYVSRTFVPIILSATYHMQSVLLVANPFTSWQTIAGMCIAIFFIVVLAWKRTRETPLGIGTFLFVAGYLPFSQFFLRGGDIVGERWMYFPSIGLVWGMAWAIERLIHKNVRIGVLVGLLIVSAYIVRTVDRNTVWQNPQALFESMIRDAPRSIKGYVNMAHYSLEQGYYDDAERFAQTALTIVPEYASMYDVMASVSYERKQYADARMYMAQALRIDPEAYDLYHNLARILFIQAEYKDALQAMDIYIRAIPVTPRVGDRILYAMLLTKNRRFAESLRYIEKNLTEAGAYAEVRFLLSVNYYFMGNIEMAEGYMTWQKQRTKASMIQEIRAFPLPQ